MAEKTMKDIPAFPVPVDKPYGEGWLAVGGATLRDLFAMSAMQAIISGVWISGHNVEQLPTDQECAERAWKYATAMMKAREKGNEGY